MMGHNADSDRLCRDVEQMGVTMQADIANSVSALSSEEQESLLGVNPDGDYI